ncbi:hypothetical protein [Streptomyces sp. NPDC085466]|uniref:hypothetical protein n=1 Tax=Streptomyces sp. NPDC085466 TaxID=3365725 RepID=UPI0037D2CE57
MIEHLGPENDGSGWKAEALGADSLAALALSPSEASTFATDWRELRLEEIRELRRHKNLTAHLDRLIGPLKPGPTRDRLLLRIDTRALLP